MLQARRLGKALLVGIHSDEEILENKGPTVMSLEERLVCRLSISKAGAFFGALLMVERVASLQWTHVDGPRSRFLALRM